MKYGPILAVIFAFFLIAIYPHYSESDTPIYIFADDDGDGVPNDKDKCPDDNAKDYDINEDGCTDTEITKEEIDYIGRLAKMNLGQYLIFAIASLLGTAIYWEREKIKSILSDEDDFLENFNKSDRDKETDNPDYADLGKDKEYTESNTSFFDRFSFSLSELNAEADRGIQVMAVVCLLCFLVAPNQAWFQVEGIKTYSEESEEFSAFTVEHYSNFLEYNGNTEVTASYDSSRCTSEIDKYYNCDYRSTLFGTVETLLSLSALFCFILLLLNFRAEKYRVPVAIVFTLCLITTMASLLVFTTLIDNALIADEHLLDDNQNKAAGCWMSEPIIWGESECISLDENGNYITETEIKYTPSFAFFIILTSVSILFVGLFTSISPLLEYKKISLRQVAIDNWQVFAIIFVIFFLWRLNVLMTNL
jgi:hypothetical protein